MVIFYLLVTNFLSRLLSKLELPVSIRRRNSKNILSTEGIRLSFKIGLKMFIIIKQKDMYLLIPPTKGFKFNIIETCLEFQYVLFE